MRPPGEFFYRANFLAGEFFNVRILPCEFLVLQTMRNDAVDAKPSLLVFLVVGKISLEPFDMGFAFEGEHMRRDPVEKEAVMRDHNGAACEILQRFFERP